MSLNMDISAGSLLSRRQQNAQQPIFRLNSDLLLRIFTLCRDLYFNTESEPRRANFWVYLTQVCHDWYTLSLHSPLLWSRIYASRGDVVRTWLLRSQDVPLFVSLDRKYSRDNSEYPLFKTVFVHLPRICTLHVSAPTLYHWPSLYDAPWAGLDAPQLRELTIFTCSPNEQNKPSLPALLLMSDMPALKTLQISDSAFRWMDRALPTTLTALHIEGLRWISTRELAEHALLSLSRLRHLQHLHLSDIWSFSYDPCGPELPVWVSALPTVSLPALQTLHLGGSMYGCLHLLNHVTIPTPCTVHLALEVVHLTFEPWTIRLHNRLLSRSSGRMAVRTLSIDGYSEPDAAFRLRLWTTPDAGRSDANPYLALDINAREGIFDSYVQMQEWSSLLHGIVAGLPLPDVETVHLCEMHQVADWANWRRVFSNMPNVRVLRVYGWVVRDLPALFCVGRYVRDEENGSEPMFPALEELELRNVSFSMDPEQEQFLDSWYDGMARWSAKGRKIEKLVLKECYNLTDEIVVSSMKAMQASAVVWDGVRQPGKSWDELDSWQALDDMQVGDYHI